MIQSVLHYSPLPTRLFLQSIWSLPVPHLQSWQSSVPSSLSAVLHLQRTSTLTCCHTTKYVMNCWWKTTTRFEASGWWCQVCSITHWFLLLMSLGVGVKGWYEQNNAYMHCTAGRKWTIMFSILSVPAICGSHTIRRQSRVQHHDSLYHYPTAHGKRLQSI